MVVYMAFALTGRVHRLYKNRGAARADGLVVLQAVALFNLLKDSSVYSTPLPYGHLPCPGEMPHPDGTNTEDKQKDNKLPQKRKKQAGGYFLVPHKKNLGPRNKIFGARNCHRRPRKKFSRPKSK